MALTVLYIEDNVSNLQLVKRIFRDRQDIALSTASRGHEGLALAQAEPPGLILLDLHLPDMHGTEVLSALRDDPRTAAIPVVAVSADATHDQVANLHANGVVDYVTKPFEVPRLLGLVESFAGGGAPAQGDAPAAVEPAPADAVLDPVRVRELLGLDPDGSTFRSLAAVALDEAAAQISTIAACASGGGNAAGVSAAAHSLKSSALTIGARRFAALAGSVERAARAGSVPDPPTLTALRRALAEAEQATNDMEAGS